MDRAVLFVAVEGAPAVFRKLVEKLGPGVRPMFHDIELGRGDEPPPGWSIDREVASIARAADDAGLSEFDLLGYSGGAAMSLAFLAAHPERVRSITLAETPWIGNDIWSDVERSFVDSFDRAVELPAAELVPAVFDLLSPGVELPPDASKIERSAEMLRVVWRGYRETPLDRSKLATFSGPVYLPVGSRSSPRFLVAAETLAAGLPNSRVEVVAGRNHFNLFWQDPTAMAESMKAAWK